MYIWNQSPFYLVYNTGSGYDLGETFRAYTAALNTTLDYYQQTSDFNFLNQPFEIGTGFNGLVRDIIESDATYIISGAFVGFNDVSVGRIVKLSLNGTKDAVFTANVGTAAEDGEIRDIIKTSEGKILVAGGFTRFNGQTHNRILRLNSDGTIDTTFNAGTGFNLVAIRLAEQSDGKYLVGGNFTRYNDTSINRIIRLNPNGAIDTTFDPGTGAQATVLDIDLTPDGKIFLGGTFTTYNNIASARLVRIDASGTYDSTFDVSSGLNNTLSVIKSQSDGKLLVGGNFTTYQGVSAPYLVRINSDGTRDASFDMGSGITVTDGGVRDIKIDRIGRILVAGYLNSYNDVSVHRIVRLYDNGELDPNFSTGIGFTAGLAYLHGLSIQLDDKILIHGEFSGYQGKTSKNAVRILPNGDIDDASLYQGVFFDGNTLNYRENGELFFTDRSIIDKGFFVNQTQGAFIQGAPDTSIGNLFLTRNTMSFSINETTNKLEVRVRYSDGTYGNAQIDIVKDPSA